MTTVFIRRREQEERWSWEDRDTQNKYLVMTETEAGVTGQSDRACGRLSVPGKGKQRNIHPLQAP